MSVGSRPPTHALPDGVQKAEKGASVTRERSRMFKHDGLDGAPKDWADAYAQGVSALKVSDFMWADTEQTQINPAAWQARAERNAAGGAADVKERGHGGGGGKRAASQEAKGVANHEKPAPARPCRLAGQLPPGDRWARSRCGRCYNRCIPAPRLGAAAVNADWGILPTAPA